MDEAKLAGIEARANAATPGPWHARTGRTYEHGKVTSVEHYIARGDDDVGIASEVCDSRTGDPSADNALFLAAARTDVPDLVAEVRHWREVAHTAAVEVARRGAIIAGRDTPPTDAELAAHAGVWMVRLRNHTVVEHMQWPDTRDWYASRGAVRWWPLDAKGRPCEWPDAVPASEGGAT